MPSVARRIIEHVKVRYPTLAWRARNAAALVPWYAGRMRGGWDTDRFDETFWRGAEVGDWDAFARTILRHFPARAVLDVGCGGGRLLQAMRDADPVLRLQGVDASGPALRLARSRGLDVVELDFAGASSDDVDAAAEALGDFDLAVCLEVAEHFPAWHAGKLMRLLARYPTVVFSAAHPLQGGVLHVNEQPAEHWIARFHALGLDLSARDEAFRRDVAALDLPPWYAANVHAFERRAGPG